jgi:biopolymer transport protein ExbD
MRFLNRRWTLMDADREVGELLCAAAKASGQEPLVQLHVDPKTSQQRVIDVLNALAGQKIANVTFLDLIEKE